MSALTMPSDEASERPKKAGRIRGWFALFSANSLLLSILLHVFFGVAATYLIVEHFQKKHVNFHASAPPAPHMEVEHKIQMEKRNSVESAPPDLKRIVTTAVSAVTLPDIPDVPQETEITPSAISGVDGTLGSGMGSGLGNGGTGSGGGGGGSPLFGSSSGTGFQGYMYDLKQTADGKPTGMTPDHYHEILKRFVSANWDPSILAPYYKSPKPLYNNHVLIPLMDANAGPKAFGLEREVQPSMWIVWYKAKVAPMDAGNYKFVGYADDILLVRQNGQNVLDGSIDSVIESLPFVTPWPNTWTHYCGTFGTLRAGKEFQASPDTPIDLDVIIGEQPGGQFTACLFIMNQDKTYPLDSGGQAILPLFSLGDAPTKYDGEHPQVNPNREPWQCLPMPDDGTDPPP